MIRYNDAPRETSKIHQLMQRWREGLTAFPPEYVEYHRQLALDELKQLEDRHGIIVHTKRLVRDGWGDGSMFVVEVIIETPAGRLLMLRWDDSSCAFMKRHERGVRSALFARDLD